MNWCIYSFSKSKYELLIYKYKKGCIELLARIKIKYLLTIEIGDFGNFHDNEIS